MDQFILFGDSILQQSYCQTQPPHGGFTLGAELSNVYIRKLDIVNRGLSGYNTIQALRVVPQVIPRPEVAKVRFLLVFFGANDARLPNTLGPPQQGVDLNDYGENLKQIIQHASVQAHRNVKVIIVTPPPIEERLMLQMDQSQFPECETPRRTSFNAYRYSRMAKAIADEMGVVCVDLWEAMMHGAGSEAEILDRAREGKGPFPGSLECEESEMLRLWLHDGLHLSPTGYQVLYEAVMKVLAQKWPDQLPENLPSVLPVWNDPNAW